MSQVDGITFESKVNTFHLQLTARVIPTMLLFWYMMYIAGFHGTVAAMLMVTFGRLMVTALANQWAREDRYLD